MLCPITRKVLVVSIMVGRFPHHVSCFDGCVLGWSGSVLFVWLVVLCSGGRLGLKDNGEC